MTCETRYSLLREPQDNIIELIRNNGLVNFVVEVNNVNVIFVFREAKAEEKHSCQRFNWTFY